jgi:hypothetical protein
MRLYPVIISLVAFSLVGCEATSPPPYQKDRSPENRDTYTGAEGAVQWQKDQNYLQKKEVSEKCEKAKLDLLVAQKEGNQEIIETSEQVVKITCQ